MLFTINLPVRFTLLLIGDMNLDYYIEIVIFGVDWAD